jgi:quercetin dioxygenase-like cupin family protein
MLRTPGQIVLCQIATAVVAGRLGLVQMSTSARTTLDNPAVEVARVSLAPDRVETGAPRFASLVIQIGECSLDRSVGPDQTNGPRGAGFALPVPPNVRYSISNHSRAVCDLVVVRKKRAPDPASDAAAPPVPVPAGIHRVPLFENAEMRVVQVRFDPAAREVPHTHPFDLLTVQITGGRVETLIDRTANAVQLAAGEVVWFPKNVTHVVGNPGASAFELLSVGIK